MDGGELCVMTSLEALMLTLCADNWDTVELQHLVWPRASKYGFVLPVLYNDTVHFTPMHIAKALVVNRFGLMMCFAYPHPTPVCDHVRGAHPLSDTTVNTLRM